MSFMLWELAKHQDVQARVRREVESAKAKNGGTLLSTEDFDNMPYLQAVVKVRRDHRSIYLNSPATFSGTLPFPRPRLSCLAKIRRGRRFATFRTHQDAIWNLDHRRPVAWGNKSRPLICGLQPVRRHISTRKIHGSNPVTATKRSGVMMRTPLDQRGG